MGFQIIHKMVFLDVVTSLLCIINPTPFNIHHLPVTTLSFRSDSGEFLHQYLLPANEVCEGYVFTGVCLSTGRGSVSKNALGSGVSAQGGVPMGGVCLGPGTRGRHPPGPEAAPPHRQILQIRSTSEQYASHWNAFLFYL